MQCEYGLNEDIYYFDIDENKRLKFRCQYDSLANAQVCKFHDNTYSTSNRAIFEGDFSNLVNEAEIENKPLSCIGFYFPPNFKFPDIRTVTYFNYCKFGKVSFDKVIFTKVAFFDNCEFNEGASFIHTKFMDDVSFKEAIFRKDVKFLSTNFIKADFSGAKHSKISDQTQDFQISFYDNDFSDELNFSNVIFDGKLLFESTKFEKLANFSHSEFNGVVWFKESSFHMYSDFHSLKCRKKAEFTDCRFMSANFSGSNFFEVANFFDSSFYDANFCSSKFFKQAFFNSTRFYDKDGQINYFNAAVFHDLTEFKDALFEKEITFANTEFKGSISFQDAKFRSNVDFKNTVFSKEVNFQEATLHEAEFINTDFHEADFFHSKFVQSETTANEKYFFDINDLIINKENFLQFLYQNNIYDLGATGLEFEKITDDEIGVMKGSNLEMILTLNKSKDILNIEVKRAYKNKNVADKANIYKIHKIVTKLYDKAELVPIKFDYSTIRKRMRFIGSDSIKCNLSSISFKGVDLTDVEFHKVKWLQSKTFLFHRNSIIDEKIDDRDKNYQEISAIYNQLRKNYESKLRFNEGSDFFIGEMECRKKHLISEGNKLKATGYQLYEWIALYGESALLPLVFYLPIMIIGFSIARILMGYEPPSNIPLATCEIHTYNISNFCNASIDSISSFFQFPRSQSFLDIIERIFAVPILGTAFIALKRKYERSK
jgi:uncharacterized protein YjbI with pentapeptide repeats